VKIPESITYTCLFFGLFAVIFGKVNEHNLSPV